MGGSLRDPQSDGSLAETQADSRNEWVRFPLMVGSGWAFQVRSRGRTIGSSERYEYHVLQRNGKRSRSRERMSGVSELTVKAGRGDRCNVGSTRFGTLR